MRLLTLPEYSTRAYAPLPAPVARALAATSLVRVGADLSGRTTFTATSQVGVVRAGDVELRVTPKIGMSRLMWLIGSSMDPGWREEDTVGVEDADDMVTAVAVSFLATGRRALAAGVLQGYRTRDEALLTLRGRLREADQLRRRLGTALPLEVSYDDYTVDIAENQILQAATLRLLRLPGVPATTRHGLRRLSALLADVTPLPRGVRPPVTVADRLTRRYQPSLRLAQLVLAGRSIEQRTGEIAATGFVFDLNRVFEQWLTAQLAAAAIPHGGTLGAQQLVWLDTDRKIDMRPDMIWRQAGKPVTVLDAKYKHAALTDAPNENLYQMLAYCTALGFTDGHLLYAQGHGAAGHVLIRRAGIRIHTWALDLTQPIAAIRQQIAALAVALAAASGRSHQLGRRAG